MRFYEEKGFAACGLACPICSVTDCPGCYQKGCENVGECGVYLCTRTNSLLGCYECNSFPCDQQILENKRLRAFNRYAQRFGAQRLMDRLRENQARGVVYHHEGGLTGDYDVPETERAIMALIEFGPSYDPYAQCPSFDTERFHIRMVEKTDAEDLLACYSDEKAQPLFNADRCTSDFCYASLDEMQECIDFFHHAYEVKAFIRWSVVDKALGKAVGTVEMFAGTPGVLRLDIASGYEEESVLEELLGALTDKFHLLFDTEEIVTKAVPRAVDRIAALANLGYGQANFLESEDYYSHKL